MLLALEADFTSADLFGVFFFCSADAAAAAALLSNTLMNGFVEVCEEGDAGDTAVLFCFLFLPPAMERRLLALEGRADEAEGSSNVEDLVNGVAGVTVMAAGTTPLLLLFRTASDLGC